MKMKMVVVVGGRRWGVVGGEGELGLYGKPQREGMNKPNDHQSQQERRREQENTDKGRKEGRKEKRQRGKRAGNTQGKKKRQPLWSPFFFSLDPLRAHPLYPSPSRLPARRVLVLPSHPVPIGSVFLVRSLFFVGGL